MNVNYLLLQNLLTLAYLICLLLIVIIFYRPFFLNNLYDKIGIFRLKYYYYFVPGIIGIVFFTFNYIIQSIYFEQVGGAGPILDYYKTWLDLALHGLDPFDPNLYETWHPPMYGPLTLILFIAGLTIYNNPFAINLLLFLFYLGTVLVAVAFGKDLFQDRRYACTVGIITALNPLLWYTAITMLTTDIFVVFTILLISYLFFRIDKTGDSSKKKIVLIAGISTGILASLKFIPLIVFVGFLISKLNFGIKDRIIATLSCGITFLLIHIIAYYYWGLGIIKWAYIFPASLYGDFSPILLFSDYIPRYGEAIIFVSSFPISISLPLMFAGLLLAYTMVIRRGLSWSSTIVIMTAFYLVANKVHVAYFSWIIVIPILYALYYKKSEIAIPSFLIILIPRLWSVFVEKKLGSTLEIYTQIMQIVLILAMIITLLFLSNESMKVEKPNPKMFGR
jgi:hypothetical protein|tara:strand:+ start:2981 stop:4327 length:1347 start_codon:yes stop_codon:yes gene_type:complete